MLNRLIKEKLWFIIPYLAFLLVAGFTLLNQEKGTLVLRFEEYRHSFSDLFFRFYTYVGDGAFAVFACLLLLFVSRKIFFSTASALIVSSLITQLLKRFVFGDHARPAGFFGEFGFEFHPIEGLVRHLEHSMPSGHTTTAFCLFSMLAFYSPKRTWGGVLFILAALVGISRMYLAQHFLEDVIAGSFIGVFVSLVVFLIFEKRMSGPTSHKPVIKLG